MRTNRCLLPLILLSTLGCAGLDDDSGLTGYQSQAVAVADVDGDGHLDALGAHARWVDGRIREGSLTTRLQRSPGGTFAEPRRVDAGLEPVALAVGDLDGDGRVDAVVANWEERNGTGEVTVHLQAGMPEGTFQADPVVVSLVGRRPGDVAIGDLNGDGRPDLAIAARDGQDALVVPQHAGGGFGTAVSVPVGGVPRAVAVADLNGDGRADLAVATDQDEVVVFHQDSGGQLAEVARKTVGARPLNLRIADLDADARPDLLVACFGESYDGLAVILREGAGGYEDAVFYDSGDEAPAALAVADFDGDGHLDVAVANYGAPGFPGSVGVLFQDGTAPGTFNILETYRGYHGPSAIAAGDLDGDGQVDLILSDGSTDVRFQETGVAGRFLPPVTLRP